ncbi:MAG: PAS domain-containing sensor histidine kinase, partial [Spirochaetales bacterium]|nr:PAS domain-containing sensor histidine kinase [Spirochaetales bacterium]
GMIMDANVIMQIPGNGNIPFITAAVSIFVIQSLIVFFLAINRNKLKRRLASQVTEKGNDAFHFQNADIILILLNKAGEIKYINKRGCEILGFSGKDLPGKRWDQTFLSETNLENFQKTLENIEKNGKSRIRNYYENRIKKGKNEKIIGWHLTDIYDESGSVTGISVIGDDITKKRIARETEWIIQKQFIQNEKTAAMGMFITSIAHEINNPNQYIQANTQYLKEAWKSILPIIDRYYRENGDFLLAGLYYSESREKINELFDRILSGSTRIKNILEELKDIVFQEKNGLRDRVNLNDVIVSAINLLKDMLDKSTHNFNFIPDPALAAVYGNYRRLEQVIINLLHNACKAVDNPSQGIRIETKNRDQKHVQITIMDRGRGFDGQMLNGLDMPVINRDESEAGIGLGLYVSSNIVKSYGGTLKINSEGDEGSKVILTFPRAG